MLMYNAPFPGGGSFPKRTANQVFKPSFAGNVKALMDHVAWFDQSGVTLTVCKG